MANNRKMVVIAIAAYLVMLAIGFRAGQIYQRMKHTINIEKVVLPEAPVVESFYIVEKKNYGTYENVEIYEAYNTHPYLKMIRNEKLRKLLEGRDLQIYTSDGQRIY